MPIPGQSAALLRVLLFTLACQPACSLRAVAATEPPAARSDQQSMPRPAPAARTAKAGTIRVNVLKDADEYLVANGQRYIRFNSPSLAAAARPLAEPAPRYPQGKIQNPHGAVLLQLLINEGGTLDQVSVVCATPAFEKSAMDSVKNIHFSAARARSGPVKSFMLVEIGYGRGFPCGRVPD